MVGFEGSLSAKERRLVERLDSPAMIQRFLDEVPYSTDDFYRCPVRVLRERRAHCFDGALFAAAALRRLGHPPIVLELVAPEERDDVHLLALYRVAGHWGAVAKSNVVCLRFREAVYRTLRELAMSFFSCYFNICHERTLRGYRGPLDLRRLDPLNWMACDDGLEKVAERLDRCRLVQLITPAMVARLSQVDPRTYRAGLLGANPRGLFRPRGKGSEREEGL